MVQDTKFFRWSTIFCTMCLCLQSLEDVSLSFIQLNTPCKEKLSGTKPCFLCMSETFKFKFGLAIKIYMYPHKVLVCLLNESAIWILNKELHNTLNTLPNFTQKNLQTLVSQRKFLEDIRFHLHCKKKY